MVNQTKNQAVKPVVNQDWIGRTSNEPDSKPNQAVNQDRVNQVVKQSMNQAVNQDWIGKPNYEPSSKFNRVVNRKSSKPSDKSSRELSCEPSDRSSSRQLR